MNYHVFCFEEKSGKRYIAPHSELLFILYYLRCTCSHSRQHLHVSIQYLSHITEGITAITFFNDHMFSRINDEHIYVNICIWECVAYRYTLEIIWPLQTISVWGSQDWTKNWRWKVYCHIIWLNQMANIHYCIGVYLEIWGTRDSMNIRSMISMLDDWWITKQSSNVLT